jgi:hypothetical protein
MMSSLFAAGALGLTVLATIVTSDLLYLMRESLEHKKKKGTDLGFERWWRLRKRRRICWRGLL